MIDVMVKIFYKKIMLFNFDRWWLETYFIN